MSLTFGRLRSWRAAGVSAASDELRVDVLTLEKARDVVESDAVPDAWTGLGRWTASAAAASRPSAKPSTDDAHASIPSSHAVANAGITLAVLLPGRAPASAATASAAAAARARVAADRRSLAVARSSSGSTW